MATKREPGYKVKLRQAAFSVFTQMGYTTDSKLPRTSILDKEPTSSNVYAQGCCPILIWELKQTHNVNRNQLKNLLRAWKNPKRKGTAIKRKRPVQETEILKQYTKQVLEKLVPSASSIIQQALETSKNASCVMARPQTGDLHVWTDAIFVPFWVDYRMEYIKDFTEAFQLRAENTFILKCNAIQDKEGPRVRLCKLLSDRYSGFPEKCTSGTCLYTWEKKCTCFKTKAIESIDMFQRICQDHTYARTRTSINKSYKIRTSINRRS